MVYLYVLVYQYVLVYWMVYRYVSVHHMVSVFVFRVFDLTVSFPLETELLIAVMDHNLVGSDDFVSPMMSSDPTRL